MAAQRFVLVVAGGAKVEIKIIDFRGLWEKRFDLFPCISEDQDFYRLPRFINVHAVAPFAGLSTLFDFDRSDIWHPRPEAA